MYCSNCGRKNDPDANFCEKCGAALTKESVPVLRESAPVTSTAPSTQSEPVAAPPTGKGVIKCGNCGYIGPGEPARSLWAKILAWICVIFAPLITILYFVATHKYRCPKCHSTFLGIRNKNGEFIQGQNGVSRAVTIIILVFVGLFVIGVLAAVVLASLNTARAKSRDAAIESRLDSIRAEAEVYYGGAGDNSYGNGTDSCADGMFAADATIASELQDISSLNPNGEMSCAVSTDGSAYALQAQLTSDSGTYWCVDSAGLSKEETSSLGAGTRCP
ncbi:MAG: zinc ribbon domain-containing protein [Patescibacteria group bacterium]|nr:zinc ribbon domain-containing protein [Patescibacteria group bacterium]MDE1944170.1 zinc ribbon domain-containing protein [Patescibacteria group bacterium]MDE1945446.1 zinc ribbon domain-containing protein [Patescibacteria group bacterium]MDE2057249.1 zinc ribbon domain-containing protein [Patescibacteria group bacterium]